MTTTSALFSAFLNPPRIILNFSNNHQKFNPCKNSNPSFNRSSWIKNPNPLFIQIPNKIQITHQTKKLNPNSTIQNSSHGPPNPKNTNTPYKRNSKPETNRNRDNSTGMYLNFRRGGSSGAAVAAALSLAELLSALVPLLLLCEMGVHL